MVRLHAADWTCARRFDVRLTVMNTDSSVELLVIKVWLRFRLEAKLAISWAQSSWAPELFVSALGHKFETIVTTSKQNGTSEKPAAINENAIVKEAITAKTKWKAILKKRLYRCWLRILAGFGLLRTRGSGTWSFATGFIVKTNLVTWLTGSGWCRTESRWTAVDYDELRSIEIDC